ncbi:hypothetical protein HQ45_01155 [Porphyromonas crevioricanis]|uniref:Uncharacterized protein n=1 Tax=Porphyromonas crevioricanis TaxID=393921 RepID=A0AB34PGV0_9PORP|nr:hypothetical protein HQ45_01155 [Porphyromonas crevioricanis]KGN93994.1 hypothetical protein HQ38_07245 [Porphyromonas crevioricanis]
MTSFTYHFVDFAEYGNLEIGIESAENILVIYDQARMSIIRQRVLRHATVSKPTSTKRSNRRLCHGFE